MGIPRANEPYKGPASLKFLQICERFPIGAKQLMIVVKGKKKSFYARGQRTKQLGGFGSLALMIRHGNDLAFRENVTDLLIGCKRSKLGNNREDVKDVD